MKIFYTLLLFILISSVNCTKENPEYDNSLAGVINTYRFDKGLTKISISVSLTKVAEAHVKDLADNQPNNGNCNMHSWSDMGDWSACCYTSDHAQASCMWDKPREITNYKGNGYEIAAWSSGIITVEQALSIWQDSEGHHNVILNKDIWASVEWNAIGAAIYEGYAVVWFGKEVDTQ